MCFELLYGCCGSGYAEPYMGRLWYDVVTQMGMMSNFQQVSEVISFTFRPGDGSQSATVFDLNVRLVESYRI